MEGQNLTTKKKKKWLLPTIIAVIIVIIAISAIAVYNLPANRRDRQLALAEKYMSELNYEAAILAYKAVIEIDPKNIEAYHGAVEAYSLADNKDGYKDLYTDALNIVEGLSDEELDATIELVKDIYLSASNVYDDNEKTAEVLEKGYEVTNNNDDLKNSLVDTYENIVEDCQNTEKPDSEKILDVCDRILELDKSNTKITDTRRTVLEEYLKNALKNGNSDTVKELIKKYSEWVPDVDYEKLVENCINDLFDNEDYETIKKLVNELKETFPDMNLDEMLTNIEVLEQQAAQKQALLITVFDYMSVEDYDSMLDVDGSDEAEAVRDILTEQERTSCIYIPDDDGTHTGTGAGIYLFGNGGYYFYYGNFVDGIREGNGCIFMKMNGTYKYIFTGEWMNDAPNGIGYIYKKSQDFAYYFKGELINGLWNGRIEVTYTDNLEWDVSFNATNGIPDALENKEDYYTILNIETTDNMVSYEILWGKNIFPSQWYTYDTENSCVFLNENGNQFEPISTISMDNSIYICALDAHADSTTYLSWVSLRNSYGSTIGVIGFADNY